MFDAYGVTLVPYEFLKIDWVEGYPYVKRDELDAAIKEMAEHNKNEIKNTLNSIVEEYRRERTTETSDSFQPGS